MGIKLDRQTNIKHY